MKDRELYTAMQKLPSATWVGAKLVSGDFKEIIAIDGYVFIDESDDVPLAELALKFGICVESVIMDSYVT